MEGMLTIESIAKDSPEVAVGTLKDLQGFELNGKRYIRTAATDENDSICDTGDCPDTVFARSILGDICQFAPDTLVNPIQTKIILG